MGLTPRQVRRLVDRYRVDGAAGLAYRHSNRVLSNRRRSVEHRAEALRPVRAHDQRYGPTLASEMLLPVAVQVEFTISKEHDITRSGDAVPYAT